METILKPIDLGSCVDYLGQVRRDVAELRVGGGWSRADESQVLELKKLFLALGRELIGSGDWMLDAEIQGR